MPGKVGKPKGGPGRKAGGTELVSKIRMKISTALHILDNGRTPIEKVLAAQLLEDPAGTLQKLSKFMPQDVNTHHTGDIHLVRKEYVLSLDGTVRAAPPLESEALPAPDVDGAEPRH